MAPNHKTRGLETALPPGTKSRARLRSQLHPKVTHGGPESRGRRKTKRPFFTSAPLHLVLASRRAKGSWCLSHRRNHGKIQSMIYRYAERFKIRVHQARVNRNEVQLLVQAKDRKNLADYLRVLAGRVAVGVTGAQKGVRRIGKFWNELCWSKIINWGREFSGIREFIRNLNPLSFEGELVVAFGTVPPD